MLPFPAHTEPGVLKRPFWSFNCFFISRNISFTCMRALSLSPTLARTNSPSLKRLNSSHSKTRQQLFPSPAYNGLDDISITRGKSSASNLPRCRPPGTAGWLCSLHGVSQCAAHCVCARAWSHWSVSFVSCLQQREEESCACLLSWLSWLLPLSSCTALVGEMGMAKKGGKVLNAVYLKPDRKSPTK